MLESSVTIKCDLPGCDQIYTWIESEVAQDGSKLPPGAYRFLILALPFSKEKWTFCSKYCLLEFMKSYVPMKSPKEQADAVEEKRKEIEEKEKRAAEVERMATVSELALTHDLGGES
jgi:hypothetical protein